MKKKAKIILIISLIMLILLGCMIYFTYKIALKKISNNIKLDTDNYLTSVEIKSKSNFILFINKNKKISNIIFLNNESVASLYKKDIENNNIEGGVKKIVDLLKSDDEFSSEQDFQLISYGNDNIYNLIKEEFNKEFVIYGVNKNILEGNTTLIEKLENKVSNNKEALKYLYNESLNMVSSSYKGETNNYNTSIKDEDFGVYATNVYNKLVNYSVKVTEQEKDSMDAMDITTLNASGSYDHELYATTNSWYYVSNGVVYSYVEFNYNDKIYSYCFNGTESYIENKCQQNVNE